MGVKHPVVSLSCGCWLSILLSSPHQPGTVHHAGEGEGALAPGAPTKEEFLQYGVENGGDHSTLERGFTSCRRGSVKDIIYKVCPQEDQGRGQTVSACCWTALLAVDIYLVRKFTSSKIFSLYIQRCQLVVGNN